MGLSIPQNPTSIIGDPFGSGNVGSSLNSKIIQALSDPFGAMKSRCIPTSVEGQEYLQRTCYYLATRFPETDLESPSFNGSPQFMNLLVDNKGILLKLVFHITNPNIVPPPGQFIVEVVEYFVPGKPTLARKFVSYQ